MARLLAILIALAWPSLAFAQTPASSSSPQAEEGEEGTAEEETASEEETAEAVPEETTSTTAAEEQAEARLGATRPLTNMERQANINDRAYQLSAYSQFRTLATVDETPANDRYVLYGIRGDVRLEPTLSVFTSMGLTQNFVAEPDESGWQLQDWVIGVDYLHRMPLSGLGIDRDLAFSHRLQLFLPTSRQSRAQDLYLATQNTHRARINITDELVTGLDFSFQYRWHEYAERAGYSGGLNTRLILGGAAVVEYTLLDDEDFGVLLLGVDARTRYLLRYQSRDSYQSDASDQAPWMQDYGWDAYLYYFPIPQLIFAVSLEHNGQVLRNGVVNTFFTHRDETELAFLVMGRY